MVLRVIRMKKSNKILVNLILLVSSLFFCLAINSTSTVSVNNLPPTEDQYKKDYISHDPIIITSDDNFSDYGFLGTGTEANPYRIDDLHIQDIDAYGIYIKSVTMHFVITNCLIEDVSTGIHLYGISWNSCRVEHNIITGVDKGIHVYSVTNGTIFDNTIEADYTGIEIESAGYLAIINNTISDTIWQGIDIDNDAGTIITGNNFYNSGITVGLFSKSFFDTFTIEDNFVNDKPLGFFRNQDDLVISAINDYGALILYNCHRAAISNQDLSYCTIGVLAYECNSMTIYDCDFEHNYAGIEIDYSDDLYVHNSRFKHTTQGQAIKTYDCNNGYFFNNYFEDVFAFKVEIGHNTEIIQNDFYDVAQTLFAQFIYNLTFNENSVLESDWGVQIYSGDLIEIYDNIFYRCYIGVALDESYNAIILHNLFQEHISVAIRIEHTSGNCTIYHNTFVDNDQVGYYHAQVYDNGTNDMWYNDTLLEGNYWDDWTSGPYDILGDAGYQDLFPLSNPTKTPFIPEFDKSLMASFIILPILVCIPYFIIRRKKRKTN